MQANVKRCLSIIVNNFVNDLLIILSCLNLVVGESEECSCYRGAGEIMGDCSADHAYLSWARGRCSSQAPASLPQPARREVEPLALQGV